MEDGLKIENTISEEDVYKFKQILKEQGFYCNLKPVFPAQKLYICNSRDEFDEIVGAAESLMLQYIVRKYHELLWHVSVVLE